MSQVSAPVSTIVIASDIAGATAFGANVLQAFDQVLAVARALGFLTQDPGRPNLTLTLSPDQDGGAPLGVMARAAADFDTQVRPLRLRTMVHFGVVFRTETVTGVSYLGSAIRSAQSALRRAPSAGGMLATADFASYAARLPSLPFQVQAVNGAAAVDGLSELVFGGSAGNPAVATARVAPGAVDAAFVDFVKRRLADEIGPFANALVDRAAGGAVSAEQVLAALGQHIDGAAARKKFEDDVLRFVKSRARNPKIRLRPFGTKNMGFFSKLLNQSQPAACVLPETHAVVRQIIGVLAYDVVATADWGARVAPALNFAVEYYDKQIALIPGPFDISAAHYMSHPLVHALFPARQEIAHGIGRSVEVKQPLAFIAGAEQPEAFALLGVRRQKIPGAAAGDPAFADHTLRCLAATESGARQGLRTAALGRLVSAYGEHLDRLRKHEKLPRAEWNIENRADPALADAAKDAMVLASEELQPEKMLRGLLAWLQRPAEHLQVTGEAGAAVTADAALQIDSLPELRIRDRRCWLVCFVRFPTAEGVAAMHNEHGQHRYIRI